MASYPGLSLLAGRPDNFPDAVVNALREVWLDEYFDRWMDADVVETIARGFAYLFDIKRSRLIAAWGLSRGRHNAPRDKNRMRYFPLSEGPDYHRGHAIAHSLGGTNDINLVPQLARINMGAFKILEMQAAKHPGSLYFTYWAYRKSDGTVPSSVDQGLLVPGKLPLIRHFGN